MAANLQLKRLDIKAIKKAESFAKEHPGECLSVVLAGDRTTALTGFVEPRYARDLTSGNKAVALFDLFAEIAGVKKQALVYQEARAALIEGRFEAPTPTVSATPTATEAPNMTTKPLPKNVLDFKIPFETSNTPRPGRS